jgi:hypothetical protein
MTNWSGCWIQSHKRAQTSLDFQGAKKQSGMVKHLQTKYAPPSRLERRGMGSYVAPLNFMTHNPIHPHTKHRARGTPLRPKYKHQERAKK